MAIWAAFGAQYSWGRSPPPLLKFAIRNSQIANNQCSLTSWAEIKRVRVHQHSHPNIG